MLEVTKESTVEEIKKAYRKKAIQLNDRENARFLSQWEQSGVTSKSRFIAARLFGEPFRVVKVDK